MRILKISADVQAPQQAPQQVAASQPQGASPSPSKANTSAPPPAVGLKAKPAPQVGQPQAATPAKPGSAKVPQGQPALPTEVIKRLLSSVNSKNTSSGVLLTQWLSNANSATALMNILEVIGSQAPYYKSVIQQYLIQPQQEAAKAKVIVPQAAFSGPQQVQ